MSDGALRDVNNVLYEKIRLGFRGHSYGVGQVRVIPDHKTVRIVVDISIDSDEIDGIEAECKYDEFYETALDALDRADRRVRRHQIRERLHDEWKQALIEWKDN